MVHHTLFMLLTALLPVSSLIGAAAPQKLVLKKKPIPATAPKKTTIFTRKKVAVPPSQKKVILTKKPTPAPIRRPTMPVAPVKRQPTPRFAKKTIAPKPTPAPLTKKINASQKAKIAALAQQAAIKKTVSAAQKTPPKKQPTFMVNYTTHNGGKKSFKAVDRDLLFEDIMGMSELEFQKNIAGKTGTKPPVTQVSSWFAKNKAALSKKTGGRSETVLKGSWAQKNLQTLRTQAEKILLAKSYNHKSDFGTLESYIHNPKNPQATDIRWMQEHFAKNNPASRVFFMIASNFNALEGGMGDYRRSLNDMNHGPVQGEEAQMATMGAAIAKRYFIPKINLLSGLSNVLDIDDSGSTPIIKGAKQQLDLKDIEGFSVGINKDIIITSGYNPDNKTIRRSRDPRDNRTKPAYNSWIDHARPLYTNHIYTAAHNINPAHRKDIRIGDLQKIIAADIIYAAYEATILAAIVEHADTLVLTMLGAGAFKNDPTWIIVALRRMQEIIVASGLRIIIVVRHADAKVQQQFENELHALKNSIDQVTTEALKDPAGLKNDIKQFFAERN